jgi:hypothetical protein
VATGQPRAQVHSFQIAPAAVRAVRAARARPERGQSLTSAAICFTMQILPSGNISLAAILKRPHATLERQSVQLLGYFDALFQRLMLGPQARSAGDDPKSGTEPSVDCSREEIRAMILLGASGQTTMRAWRTVSEFR